MRAKKININIVGAGEIGVALAGQLTADGCSVTVIDTDPAVLSGVANTLDVFCYQGNGASHATLQEAGAGDADVFIAVTESDELNILACLTATCWEPSTPSPGCATSIMPVRPISTGTAWACP